MGSLGAGEILVIVLVALIVFGPERLPEISRKAGEWLAKAREMTRSVTETIDAEYGDMTEPIKNLKNQYDATMSDMRGIASSVTDMSIELPEAGRQAAGDRKQASDDAGVPDGHEPPTSDEEAS